MKTQLNTDRLAELRTAAAAPHAFEAHRRDNQCEACGLGETQHAVLATGQARLILNAPGSLTARNLTPQAPVAVVEVGSA